MGGIKPDDDDLDGQGEHSIGSIGGNNVPENDDGGIDPAKLVSGYDGGSGDDYARNPDGSIKRNKDGSPQRKRGRKSGSGGSGGNFKASTGGNKALKDSIDSLSQIIGIVHLGLSSVSKCPELKLDASESEALAKATANVLAQFDVTPDPKVTAVVGLVTTAGTIYGPRAFLIRTRKAEEKESKKSSGDNVAVFPSGMFSPGAGNA